MKPSNILLIIGSLAVIFILKYLSSLSSESSDRAKRIYHYFAKESLMSASEDDFFNVLTSVVGHKYLVFPQVHLSAILNEKINGQNWKTAFRSINQKSVDYVIADKVSHKTLLAIELDDSTHNRKDRQERDELVERIFSETTIPLVRFKNYRDLTHEQVRQKLFEHLG